MRLVANIVRVISLGESLVHSRNVCGDFANQEDPDKDGDDSATPCLKSRLALVDQSDRLPKDVEAFELG